MESAISCSELFVRLGDDDIVVLDCREDEDWERYVLHIPGALRMPPRRLAEWAHMLPDDELIVLCGSAPDGADEHRAQRFLRKLGFDTACLDGGLHGWISLGFPTDRHPGRHLSAVDRHPRQSA